MHSRNTLPRSLPWTGLALSLALLLAGSAFAAPPSQPSASNADTPYQDGPDRFQQGGGNFKRPPLAWEQLSPGQKTFLKPLKSQWDTLPPWRQHRMAERVEEWKQLPPERRAMVQQRFARLAQMTPEQRREATNGERRFQTMAPADRQRAFNTWFQSLSPEQRQALVQKFRADREAHRGSGRNDRGGPAPQR